MNLYICVEDIYLNMTNVKIVRHRPAMETHSPTVSVNVRTTSSESREPFNLRVSYQLNKNYNFLKCRKISSPECLYHKQTLMCD